MSYSITNLLFWINFVYFAFAIFISFYIPGRVILGINKKFSQLQTITFSTIIGLVFFSWQGFIFGYLHMRLLTYVYLLTFFIIFIKSYKSYLFNLKFRIKSIDLLAFTIILFGIFIQVFQLGGSGLPSNGGIQFYSTANDDGIWHVALTNQLIKNIPPEEPGMAGQTVINYHYWGNLVNAELIRVFHLPSLNLHFQYINVFLSLFLGLSAYTMAILITGMKSAARWFIFLLYFGGDLIYLITIFTRKTFEFGVHPLEDGTTFLENPPRAFSIIIALAGTSLFYLWIKNKSRSLAILSAFLFGSAVGFKVYTGILLLSALGFVMLINLYCKQLKYLWVFLLSIFIFSIIFFSNNSSSGGLFWDPFWHPINFSVQDKLNMSMLELRRRVYLEHGNLRGILQMEIIMTIIFVLSQFGTKCLGFLQNKRSLLLLGKDVSAFLFGGILTTWFLGLFFLQKSGMTNSFNFFLAGSIFLTFLASVSLGFWQRKMQHVLILGIVIFMLACNFPRIIYKTGFILKSYKTNYVSFHIGKEELQALNFLKTNTDDKNSQVLVYGNGTADYLTPYVSFFSNRPMFLSGQNILLSHNVDIKNREKIGNEIFTSSKEKEILKRLKENNIKYIYLSKNQKLQVKDEKIGEIIFSNDSVKIIKTRE